MEARGRLLQSWPVAHLSLRTRSSLSNSSASQQVSFGSETAPCAALSWAEAPCSAPALRTLDSALGQLRGDGGKAVWL